eukprot:Opistho-1_new@97974
MPTCVTAPATRSPSTIRSSTACWNSQRLGWFSSVRRIAALYSTRSAWARVARTAGPLELFRMRNWMPPSSVASAMAPPSASTSFTRWPLPMPPMLGLQLIWPSVSMLCVSSSVAQPMRAAASAASVPACPPPTTMTSNSCGYNMVVIASGVLWPGAPGNPQLSHRCAVSALPGPLRHNAGMSHTPTPLLIFAGSTRAQSHNRRLAQVAAGMARAQGAQVPCTLR